MPVRWAGTHDLHQRRQGVIGGAGGVRIGNLDFTFKARIEQIFKGEIQIANPNSSGTAYNTLATLVQIMGEDQAFDFGPAGRYLQLFLRQQSGVVTPAQRTGINAHGTVTCRCAGLGLQHPTAGGEKAEGTGLLGRSARSGL
jgi:hypothetical protein